MNNNQNHKMPKSRNDRVRAIRYDDPKTFFVVTVPAKGHVTTTYKDKVCRISDIVEIMYDSNGNTMARLDDGDVITLIEGSAD